MQEIDTISMSSVREVEVNIQSSCTYQPAWLDATNWEVSASETDYPCNVLEPGTTIRIAPMARQYGGWNEAHFHPNLRLPLGCNVGTGVVVMLEGKNKKIFDYSAADQSHSAHS